LPADAHVTGAGPFDLRDQVDLGPSYGEKWKDGDVFFEAGYIEIGQNLSAADKKAALDKFTKNMLALAQDFGWQVARDGSVNTNGNEGREIEFEGPYNRYISRIYLHDWCLVRLRASFKTERAKALGFLDSLKLTTRAEIAEQKIRDATPTEFPGPPILGQASDLKSYLLKGRVQKEITEKETIDKTRPSSGRQKSSEMFFDTQGRLIKAITYDDIGHPDAVTIYGALDGMNVMKTGFAANERIFSGAAAGAAVKKRDQRYHTRVEIRYDEKKRVAEEAFYDNAGDLFSRTVYQYGEHGTETLHYDGKSELEKRVTETLDKNGSVSRSVSAWLGRDAIEYIYDYEYLAFDKKGNWTKRSVSCETKRAGGDSYRTDSVEYRTITYYR
jgi:hypothetical protein